MGQSGGRNPHLHHQHHGGLTLGVGVGVDSCLLLNDQFTSYSILIPTSPRGLTLVSGCDVGAVDSCLLLNDHQFTRYSNPRTHITNITAV